MSTIAVTPGTGRNIQTYQDGDGIDHPAGVLEILESNLPVGVSAAHPVPVSAAALPLPTGAATESTLAALNGKVTAINTGAVTISAALPAGSNTIGGVTHQAATTGGATPYSYLAAASANQDSQVIKAGAGQLYGLHLFNASTEARFVKVYNKATAPTSVDVPVMRHLLRAGGGAVMPMGLGVVFSAGISFRITKAVADNDTTSADANDVLINALYK